MDEFDDDFLLRPGPGRSQDRATPGFVGQVRRAALKAADPGAGRRYGRRGQRAGLARGAGRSARDLAGARRVIIKVRVVRQKGARFRAAPLSRHIAYLEREGVTRDGDKAQMFGAGDEVVDGVAFAARCEGDRHHFRFIVSPEDATDLADLRAFARDLMGQVERDLGTGLDWVAVDHWNTDNPHLHILVRGKADDGRDLVISGDYIAQGMRTRAQELVSLELGPRTALEIETALDREMAAERWTSLDRKLVAVRDFDGVIDLRPTRSERSDAPRLLGRAQYLQGLGLAQERGPGRWRLDPDLEVRLRDLALRGDIIKTLHRAMALEGLAFDPARLSAHAEDSTERVIGRLVERGLHDELSGSAYAVVDGVDGRQHHLRFADLADTGDAAPGAIVEAMHWEGRTGLPVRQLSVRSDLSLADQIEAHGATWLDRVMIHRATPTGVGGFGQAVAEAVNLRGQVLVQRGLARAQGDQIAFRPGLLERLRSADLSNAAANIAQETGLVSRSLVEGESVSGVYRRRVDLASGRFAMLDDGLGFQLVPWRPSLEARLGQPVRGLTRPGGAIDWQLGRSRGLGL